MQKNQNIKMEQFRNQREELEYFLTKHETGIGKFLVVNNEAGFGKSRFSDKAIINEEGRNYLLVKKYNSEKAQSYQNMKDTLDDVWGMQNGNDTVKILVINAENSSEYESQRQNELLNTKIVIISHEKYRLLSGGGALGLYKHGRHTLIIDEYIDVPIVNINATYFHETRGLFPRDCGRDQFNKVEDFLVDLLQTIHTLEDLNKGNLKLIELNNQEKKSLLILVDELESFYRSNYSFILRQTENIKLRDQSVTHMTYAKFFSEIRSIINNQCIYAPYNRVLSTFRTFDFWSLKNNIILDASGGILREYRIHPKFKLKKQEKVFDYRDTTIHINCLSSLKHNIENKFGEDEKESMKNYFEPIIRYIENNHINEDNTLIVNYKAHDVYFLDLKNNLSGINTAWHGNILGKNDWRQCNKLYINSILNLPEAVYVLIYSFYSKKKITEEFLAISNTRDGRAFQMKEIELIKQNFILHNLYLECQH